MIKERKWYKLKGQQMLYYGSPQTTPMVAEVYRREKSVWLIMECNPTTGKRWKSMKEVKKWLEKR